jgi:hypothetical protein
MNKKILKEDITKMLSLITYDRSDVTFIQSKTFLNEKEYKDFEGQRGRKEIEDEKLLSNADTAWIAAELAATGGLMAGAAGVVSTGGLLLIPLAVGAVVWGLWKWGEDAFGAKSISKQMQWATHRDSWGDVEKTIKEQSKSLGMDIWPLFDIISERKAERFADDFHTAFNDPAWFSNTDEDEVKRIMKRCESFLDVARISDVYGKRDGYTLEYELDDEFSGGDYQTYVEEPMKGKPLVIFNDVECHTMEELTEEITKVAIKRQEEIARDAGLTLDQARGEAPLDKDQQEKGNSPNYGFYKILECNSRQILEGCIAKVGHGGKMIEIIQTLLENAKIPLPKHGIDGKYGKETYNAVIEFQKKIFPNNKGEWDGKVGPNTMKQLIKYK